jgi:hypothetical protein
MATPIDGAPYAMFTMANDFNIPVTSDEKITYLLPQKMAVDNSRNPNLPVQG